MKDAELADEIERLWKLAEEAPREEFETMKRYVQDCMLANRLIIARALRSIDGKDAERWQKIAPFLEVTVEHRRWWEPIEERNGKQISQRIEEWYWSLHFTDEAYQLGATVRDENLVPKDAASAIDAALREEPRK